MNKVLAAILLLAPLPAAANDGFYFGGHVGYLFGTGTDYALDRRWTARAEYLYTRLGLAGFSFASPARYDSLYDLHRFRIGLNYHFGAAADDSKADNAEDRGPGTWELHGQTTFIF